MLLADHSLHVECGNIAIFCFLLFAAWEGWEGIVMPNLKCYQYDYDLIKKIIIINSRTLEVKGAWPTLPLLYIPLRSLFNALPLMI